MEELLTLRQYIEDKKYAQALELVAELEEMSKEDKFNKIFTYYPTQEELKEIIMDAFDTAIRKASLEVFEVNIVLKN